MNWNAVVTALENSVLFNEAFVQWEADGQTKATFAEGLVLPLTNAGKGVAPQWASMHPTEVARWVILFLCASQYTIDREV